jgi:hypothetical protein
MGIFDSFKKGKNKGVSVGGGQGDSMDNAIIITAESEVLGVGAEYEHIRQACHLAGKEYKIEGQSLLFGPNGKPYDEISVRLSDGTVRKFYFDISSFFGKG